MNLNHPFYRVSKYGSDSSEIEELLALVCLVRDEEADKRNRKFGF
jgi:hypothetical protein